MRRGTHALLHKHTSRILQQCVRICSDSFPTFSMTRAAAAIAITICSCIGPCFASPSSKRYGPVRLRRSLARNPASPTPICRAQTSSLQRSTVSTNAISSWLSIWRASPNPVRPQARGDSRRSHSWPCTHMKTCSRVRAAPSPASLVWPSHTRRLRCTEEMESICKQIRRSFQRHWPKLKGNCQDSAWYQLDTRIAWEAKATHTQCPSHFVLWTKGA